MKLDLTKEPRRLSGYNRSDLFGCPKPVVPTAADWITMFKAFDIHIDLYCATAGLERWEALALINGKIERCAASFPDLLALVERERERNEVPLYAEMAAVMGGRHERTNRRKARADRRADT
ncbi:MAG: hypothetical protein ACLGI6_08815 [Gammaproteobacteria bacterium]